MLRSAFRASLLLVAISGCSSFEQEPASSPLGGAPEQSAEKHQQALIGGIATFTVSGAQVLNTYTALASNAAVGATSVTVANATQLDSAVAGIGALSAGDLLLIIQMQGASISTADSATYGTVSALNNAGNHELVTLVSRSGNTLNISAAPGACNGGLKNAYTAAGGAQVIRVPQFGSLTVPAGASIIPQAWNGTTGGVVAVHVSGGLTLNGNINVSGYGFRGGTVSTGSSAALNQTTAIYRNTDASLGAEKGEGIAGSVTTYDGLSGRYGRGAPANGGGGGDAHNAGGGGGANGNNGNTWTGQGVMDTTVTGGVNGWAQDPNAGADSSGGGRGGYTFSSNDLNPTQAANAPGAAGWGGDYRREVGGLGGRPVTNDPSGRIFMGGGGGAGDANNQSGGSGGAGGGLALVIAGSISGNGALLANGSAGANTNTAGPLDGNDAPGGGGAGGTLLVSAGTLPSTLSLNANGGAGGNQIITLNNGEAEGPGGGGGGGYIAVSGGTPTRTATGALGGTTDSTGVNQFPTNGASRGANGQATELLFANYFVCQPADLSVTVTDSATTATPGGNVSYTLTVSNVGPYAAAFATLSESITPALNNPGFTCVGAGGATCGTSSGSGLPTSTGALPAGSSVTFTITGTVPSAATGSLVHSVSVAVPAPTNDPVTANNSATDTDMLSPSANLSTSLAANPSPVSEDAPVALTLTVNNAGPSTSLGVSARMVLPAGVTFVSVNGAGFWSCTQSGANVDCTAPSVDPGVAPLITVQATAPNAGGAFTVNGTVTATTADPSAANNSSSLMVTVSPVNDPPVNTVPGPQTLAEDGSRVFSTANLNRISVSDLDVGAGQLEITLTGTNGVITLSGIANLTFGQGDGVADAVMRFRGLPADLNTALNGLTFASALNFNGAAALQISTNDLGNTGSGGAQTTANTVAITVTPVNDNPTAANDTLTVAEDASATVVNVLTNDSIAPDTGETLTVNAVTQPANGTVTLMGGVVRYTPPANFNGTTSFTYTVSDGNGGTATATVNVTVTAQNDNPTANNDAFTVAEDSGSTVLNVLANDSFAPDTGETLTVTAVTQPSSGTGTVTLTAGVVRYLTTANHNGSATFTYTLSDGNGGTTTGTVTMTVTSVNDNPTAANDTLTVAEDSSATVVTVLANDSTAPDTGETLTVTAVTQPANGTVTLMAGVVRFTPAVNHSGPTSFTYTVSDGNGGTATATVNVTVTSVNDPPTAVNDTLTVAEDSAATAVSVLANDSTAPDTGETLTVSTVTQPAAGGTVTLTAGVVRFTPSPNFNGSTSFTYSISDGNGGTASATVNVTVTSVNDPPTAVSDTLTVAEDAAATLVNVLANDSFAPDTGETLTVTAVTQPANGSVTLMAGVVRFTPAPNFNGSTSFTYTVSDGNSGTATGTVNVAVTAVNDPPTAANDTLTVGEDSAATVVNVLANDSFAPDTGETLTVTAVTQPANGAVTLMAGVVRFTPAANFTGSTSFTYSLSDGNGGTAMATVNVTVTSVNDPPTAVNDTLTVAEDSAATVVNVLANDSTAPDTGETLTVTAVTQPASGGAVTLAGGVVRFTPAPNFNGSGSFTYTVSDGNSGTATATVNVTVTAVNDPPLAVNDTLTVAEDSAATVVNVLVNDSFAPDTGETLSVIAVTQPATGGTATLSSGVITFTPTANYSGSTSFTYTLSDGNGGEATGTVNVTVTNLNDPPLVVDDSFTLNEDSAATVLSVLGNDSGAPDTGETLLVTGVTQPANGTVTLAAGVVRYTPPANFEGTTTFTYTVSDGNGGTGSAQVTVTVVGVNDPPTANTDSFTVAEDSSDTVLEVLANDAFAPDVGETLSVSAVIQPANGAVSLIAGVVSFKPSADFVGTTSFTYTLSDGNGGTATGTVNVTVTPLNDNPTAADDSLTVAEDSAATGVDVLANDSTVPDTGETLTVTAVTQPSSGGAVTLVAGVVSFAPAANFNGSAAFTYTVSDGNGGSATGNVTVTVTPVNDNPTAVDDVLTVAVNYGARVVDVLANDSIAPDTGETLTVTSITQPAQGTATLSAGAVSYTPDPSFEGMTSFTYTVSDGNGGTATATVRVTATSVDTDLDGLPDSEEMTAGTNPNSPDSDSDGLTDFVEVRGGDTDPLDDDSDEDGLLDGHEDADHDGIVDGPESDPSKSDTDGDGLLDGTERGLATPEGSNTDPTIFVADSDPATTTDPLKQDTDGGGVFDGIEDANHNGRVDSGETNPNDAGDDLDADGDGVDNATEVALGLNPFDADTDEDGVPDATDGVTDTDGDGLIDARDPDSDNDGLLDGTERGLTAATASPGTDQSSPNFVPDADPSTTTDWRVADSDGDTLLDGEEDVSHNGQVDSNETDPNNPDTDDDGLTDGLEVKGANPTHALLADTDADGLSDSREDFNRNGAFDDGETNPNNPDTDEGGLYDGEEVNAGLNPLSDADDLKIAGRGCNAAGGELPLLAVFVLAVAALRRRRQAPASILLSVLLLVPVAARAQAPSSTAIDVQQFKPGPSSDDLLGLHGAAVSQHLRWQVGLWTNYGHQPLGVINPNSDHFIGQIVRSQWTTDVVGSIGLFDRFELALGLPLTYERGLTSTPATASVGGVDLRRFGLGDLRLVAKALLLKRNALELGVAVPVMFPTGGADSFYGAMGVGAQPRLAGAWRTDRFRLLLNLGVNLRRPQQLRNLTVGNELAYSAGAEVQLIERLAAEVTLAGAVGLKEQDPEELPLEALGALRYRINPLFSVTAGAGAGLTRGYGNPLFRVLAGVTFTPPFAPPDLAEGDVDHDGIFDSKDRCLNQPEDRDSFQDDDGCPDLDNDQDGLPDAVDRCSNDPETVNGFEDEDGCPDQQPLPPSDTDSDGFIDTVDKCPANAEDKDGFEDEDGCPELDNDQDGILDEADKCPNQPEVVNGTDDDDGCPDKGKAKVKLQGEKIIILDKVYFATNKDIILPRSFPLLKQVHALLRAHPELRKIRVEGHTDSVGKKSKNLDLSQRRANNVRRFLVNQGVAEDRLEAEGYGDTRPIMPNTTVRGREINRRVEFVVIQTAGTAPAEPKP